MHAVLAGESERTNGLFWTSITSSETNAPSRLPANTRTVVATMTSVSRPAAAVGRRHSGPGVRMASFDGGATATSPPSIVVRVFATSARSVTLPRTTSSSSELST